MGWRWEGGDTYILLTIDVVVWKKPMQHCKAIILQLKRNFFKWREKKVKIERRWRISHSYQL